jgi:hypothetical protein
MNWAGEKFQGLEMSMNERQIKSQMKVGAGLALFGLMCPFFWISLFSGSSSTEKWLYGVHSCIFIAIGLVFLGKGWYDLDRMRVSAGIQKSEP